MEGKGRGWGGEREHLNGNGEPAVRRATEQSVYLQAALQQGAEKNQDGLKLGKRSGTTFETCVFFNCSILSASLLSRIPVWSQTRHRLHISALLKLKTMESLM